MGLDDLVGGVLDSEPGSERFLSCARQLAGAALHPNRARAAEATAVLFRRVVEPWCDSFDPHLVQAYVWLMSEVVLAERSPVRAKLAELGYTEPEQLRSRYATITKGGFVTVPDGADEFGIRKVIVFSRVTIGADIAVSSVFLKMARVCFRNASVEFVGPRKNVYLLANDRGIERRVVGYSRSALLADRLRAWLRLRKAVEKALAPFAVDEYLVIDPDSRFTQLGMLPVADDRRYQIFQSRDYAADSDASLTTLAAEAWAVGLWNSTGVRPYLYAQHVPRVWQPPEEEAERRLVSVNLGVGGCPEKRLGGEFEDQLLELLRQFRLRILLDYGAGEDEAANVERRVANFRGSVRHVKHRSDVWERPADLMTIRAPFKQFAGWIERTWLFVGYDSAFAHAAAAIGTPVVEIFAGAPSATFRARWTPTGDPEVYVIPVDEPPDAAGVLAQVRQALTLFADLHWA